MANKYFMPFKRMAQSIIYFVRLTSSPWKMIASHMMRLNTNSTDASKYESFEKDDIDMTRLSVESRLTEKIRDAIRTRYDHDPAFYDYPGPVLFMMALDICNASQSFDID
jgi:hypothetical protein